MLGLSTGLELRLAFYGALLAAICAYKLYDDHKHIVEGRAQQQASDALAVKVHDQDVAAQKAKDEKDKVDVVQTLQGQLEELRKNALNPPAARSMRLCLTARSGNQGRAPSSVSPGTQPAKPPDQGSDSGVRDGTGAGADYGPAVRDLATAGVLLADYRTACVNWALRQQETVR